MTKKVIWLVLSCLMALSLVLASCAPAAPSEEEKPPEKPVGAEEPQYGGTLNMVLMYVLGFDEVNHNPWYVPMRFTNEELFSGDWAKGPQGTNENAWTTTELPPMDQWVGILATSWEHPEEDTIIFHLRKGVHYALNANSEASRLVNGRELTADDVVFTLNRMWEAKTCYPVACYPLAKPISITAPDKYTVVLKCPPGQAGYSLEASATLMAIIPPEVVEKYGDMQKWENSVGTGPYMLVDFVADNALTYVKNPNYWGKDPLHPQNQLPYLDGVKGLIIGDASTRIAALRTDKLDVLMGYASLGWEDAAELKQSKPSLKWKRILYQTNTWIHMRTDKPPFNDKRVRQAMHMAVDFEAQKEHLYGGNAEIYAFPVAPFPQFMDIYTPKEELPASVQALYSHDIEKAKQLLAEAGYPDGFKTEIGCTAATVEQLSILKDDWAAIGVDLKLNVMEFAVHVSRQMTGEYDGMYQVGMGSTYPFRYSYYEPGNKRNLSKVNDPYMAEMYDKIQALYFDEPARRALVKELTPYILDQCWIIQPLNAYINHAWHPWLKGYDGEWCMGNMDHDMFPKFIWLDQNLKKQMTGQ